MIDSDFGKKHWKSCALTSIPLSRPPLAAISLTSGISTAAFVNTLIYSTELSTTKPTLAIYIIARAYI